MGQVPLRQQSLVVLPVSAVKMSRCVPSWDLDDNPATARHSLRSNSNSTTPDVPMLDYEVAELTWENGQLTMHSLGPPRVPVKLLNSTSSPKYTWDKPRASGTLESIVNQATRFPYHKASLNGGGDEIVPWLDHHRAAAAAAASSATKTMDALVPCSNRSEDRATHVMESIPGLGGTCVVGCSTKLGSCSGAAGTQDDEVILTGKPALAARVRVTPEWSRKEQSASASATFGRDGQHVTVDTYEKDLGVGFTSTSLGSPENTSSAKHCTKATTADDHDSVCHSRPQREAGEEAKKKETMKSSVSTKRSRAAAIHNQSERTDKASMLDEVIEYLKQLQAQVQIMSRFNIPPMMLPMTMQQQLQMSMMAPMGMGMGMRMGMGMGMGFMDMNPMGRPNVSGISPVLPNPFMTMTSWDGSGDRLQAASAAVMPDPLSAFLACQSQPMTMDAYSRMAAMYQQMQQPPASGSKS
ncbi:transcription factor UNE10-like isoform X2 [Durio zibethinus]|uniref:Transcription factor UNE10-like isoform X2 n=1 Tax=Durio zibethinus TaxID=66656 RepID=A0A6P6AXS0_DURZI|nr:transcription factor UNE10-like isoform X2 [Durio zibethinus]